MVLEPGTGVSSRKSRRGWIAWQASGAGGAGDSNRAARLAVDMRQDHAIRIDDPIAVRHRSTVQGVGKRRDGMSEGSRVIGGRRSSRRNGHEHYPTIPIDPQQNWFLLSLSPRPLRSNVGRTFDVPCVRRQNDIADFNPILGCWASSFHALNHGAAACLAAELPPRGFIEPSEDETKFLSRRLYRFWRFRPTSPACFDNDNDLA
jgi:hypothetical protein